MDIFQEFAGYALTFIALAVLVVVFAAGSIAALLK